MRIDSLEAGMPTPVQSAKAAGLVYTADERPGIRRLKRGDGFVYRDARGKALRERADLTRIKRLAIPPAWTDVWISPLENGHLQATGRDARGRKQYRYHVRWREVRDENKYARMLAFGNMLPAIRERVEHDLELPGLPRDKVLAAIVRLMETTCIRVGNEEYARQNHSYGLTTLRDKHAAVKGDTITFDFRGKSGKRHKIGIRDRRLARIVRKCQDLPNQELFAFLDDAGQWHNLGSQDVNTYLQEISNEDFTAKDFRTWAGTVLAAIALRECPKCLTARDAKGNVVKAVEAVAKMLGNTPAICRKCYVHPCVLESYLKGQTIARSRAGKGGSGAGHRLHGDEAAVMALLRKTAEAVR